MAGVDERQAFAKLEALKDIRHKTISLEKTRVALLCDVGQMEEEERCLNEYRYSQVTVCWHRYIQQSILLRCEHKITFVLESNQIKSIQHNQCNSGQLTQCT